MSVKNSYHNNRADVLLAGPLKKLKTTRKKWFVLRAETPETSARIEYYDSERKFKHGLPPKRSIPLKTCFNINKRHDTKHKHVIALYTKDDCFCVILESEDELETWLKALLSLQRGEDSVDGEMPRPTFEHVWQVAVLNRGLGTDRTGNYRLCLTKKTLCLIKVENNFIIDLNLGNIRSCGSLKNYFFLEIGRSSLLGAGELWMDTEDPNIAQNIHSTIFHAMSTNVNREELAPTSRTRSSSATEASKPMSNGRKQIISGIPKAHVYPQAGGGVPSPGIINHQRTQSLPLADHPTITTYASSTDNTIPSLHGSSRAASIKRPTTQTSKCMVGGRERCDSMPSRPRTTSGESVHQAVTGWRSFLTPHRSQGRDVSHSPPSGSPVSPPSVGCSTDSAGSSYSLQDEVDVCPECPEGLRYNMPLTPDEAIAEEECPDSPYGDNYVPMAPPSSDDGYVDMSPRCQHNANSSTISLASATSGTPSTDLRFSDYPLDKVSSYFPSTEDDARPARAYSVGSRPETYRNKRHMELAGTPENSRVRAFSVGSKTKKLPCRVLPPHHSHSGFKSSSAPILSNSKTYSSHSSIGPMEDLMEMDFSRTSTQNVNTETNTNSGYVQMKPGIDPSQRNSSVDNSPYVDMSSGSVYMDMSGTSPSKPQPAQMQQDYNSFVDINRQYGLNEQARNYVDMNQRRKRVMSITNSNASTSPSSTAWVAEDYLDMSANNSRYQECISLSPDNNADYMPLNYNQDKPKPSETQPKTPDGYVEMTVGRSHHRQSSLDGSLPGGSNDSYANMSLGQGAKKKHPKKEKAISQPISIYPNVTSSSTTKNSSSPLSISSLLGRKPSSGTPPRMHLPLSSWTSSYSSLPRQRSRKNSQTNSKDSSSSSITTPSNSSTIFPLSLNSPSSPMKPTKSETPVALKIPAALFNALYKNSKSTAKPLNNDDYTIMDFESNKNRHNNDAVNSDYVNFSAKNEDSRSNTKPPGEERLNAETAPSVTGGLPLLAIQDTHFRPIVDDQKNGDYLFISPKTAVQDTKEVKSRDTVVLNAVDPVYETLRTVESAKISPVNFASCGNSMNSSPCPGILGENSRPSSVSSENSKGPVSRPSSTSSELWSTSSTVISCPIELTTAADRIQQDSDIGSSTKPEGKLHYASLDLAQTQDEEDSQSPKSAKSSGGNDSATQPQGETTFVYAEIDFVKSEGLKQNSQSVPSNSKVKHV